MAARHLASIHELARHVGEELAVSDWYTVPQERISAFADATDDHQWIHIDPARAARELPEGKTLAHGFLTLSLIAPLFSSALDVAGTRVSINYGFNRIRFTAPVLAGDRIRMRLTLSEYLDLAPGAQLTWKVLIERQGGDKPALIADWLMRRYP